MTIIIVNRSSMRTPARISKRPLDRLFAAPSNIAVLRALREWPEGLNGRELARVAGINQQSGRLAVARLDELGVIARSWTGSRPRMRLNEENDLVRTVVLPLLAAEAVLLEKAERRRHADFLARAKAIMERPS